jgi:predicted DCC family thiol-disulfide oxidoreductase YuxK
MIVVFDGKCPLCSAWVRFLLKRDRRRSFRFASIQSRSGMRLLKAHGLEIAQLDTLLLVDGDRVHFHTGAILRVLHRLGWPWRLAWAGRIVPAPIRDAAYRYAARNRYRLFGQRETCLVPSEEYADRFLP